MKRGEKESQRLSKSMTNGPIFPSPVDSMLNWGRVVLSKSTAIAVSNRHNIESGWIIDKIKQNKNMKK
jgi:hypothetical protein